MGAVEWYAMNSEDITPEDRARVMASGRELFNFVWAAVLTFVAVLAFGDAGSSIIRRQEWSDELWWLDVALLGVGIAAAAAAIVLVVRGVRRRRPDVELERPRLPALDPEVLVATIHRVAEVRMPTDEYWRSIPEIHVTVEGSNGAWDAVIGDLLENPERQGFMPGSSWKVNAFPKDRHWVALAPEHDNIHRLGFWMPHLADSHEGHRTGFYVDGHPGPGSDIRFAADAAN